jgi:uncharacterized protein YjcR
MRGAGGGAPKGNKNAHTHGRYAVALERRRLFNSVLRIARQTLPELDRQRRS